MTEAASDRFFLIGDEIRLLTPDARGTDASAVNKLIVESAGAGVTIVATTQQPSQLLPAVRSNSTVCCSFRNAAQEIQAVGRLHNLTPKQLDAVFTLETGQAVLSVSGRLRPCLIKIARYPHDPAAVPKSELDQLNRKSVADLESRVVRAPTIPAIAGIQAPTTDETSSTWSANNGKAAPAGPTRPARRHVQANPQPDHVTLDAPGVTETYCVDAAPPRTNTYGTVRNRRAPPPANRSARDPARLPPDSERILHVYEQSPRVMSLIDDFLGWIPSKRSRAVARITNAGLWAEGPRIEQYKTYQVTESGRDYCQQYGIRSQPDKGSRVHQVLANSAAVKIEGYLRHAFQDAEWHVKINGTAFTVTGNRIIEPDRLLVVPRLGLRVAIQAAFKHSSHEEARNLLLLTRAKLAPDAIVSAACTEQKMHAIRDQLEKQLEELQNASKRERVRRNIVRTYLDKLLKDEVDLSFLLEQPS